MLCVYIYIYIYISTGEVVQAERLKKAIAIIGMFRGALFRAPSLWAYMSLFSIILDKAK